MGRQVTNVPAAQKPGSQSLAVLSLAATLHRWGPPSWPTGLPGRRGVGPLPRGKGTAGTRDWRMSDLLKPALGIVPEP